MAIDNDVIELTESPSNAVAMLQKTLVSVLAILALGLSACARHHSKGSGTLPDQPPGPQTRTRDSKAHKVYLVKDAGGARPWWGDGIAVSFPAKRTLRKNSRRPAE